MVQGAQRLAKCRKNKVCSFLLLLLAALLLLALRPQIVLADDVPYISFAAESPAAEEILIEVPFDSLGNLYSWEFPYSDAYFSASSAQFQTSLAQASIGLAISAFRNDDKDLENQYRTYLEGAGFTDIFAFGYDAETGEDTLSGVIAMKKIGDVTLIAASPCGQGYKKEWAGNLKVGNGERHEGFNQAAQIMEGHLLQYIEEHQITGEMKLWITGFSRASAVANLTAADMIESGRFSDVFAYLFGVPRTTKAPVKYSGIFNICGGFDHVPLFPLEQWGFARYGTDIYTPAQELTSQYVELAAGADEVSRRLRGTSFINSPYVNYQMHLIVEFLGSLFPEVEDYTEEFQGTLMRTWKELDINHIAEALAAAFGEMNNLDKRQEYASDTFIEYLSLLASQNLRGNKEQIRNGQWDENASIGENYLREHMPYTYIEWLFSENEPSALYQESVDYRRLILVGAIDVYIYKDGDLLGYVDKNGTISQRNRWEANEDVFIPEIFLHRSGQETIVSLPMDDVYDVEIYVKNLNGLSYYQILANQDVLFAADGEMCVYGLQKGLYGLSFDKTSALPDLKVLLDGGILQHQRGAYSYSPFLVMRSEISNTSHLTLSGILNLAFWLVAFLILLIIVCFVIFIIHRVRRKKKGRPYSRFYVAVPHLLLIIVFAVLTQYLTLNLFRIGFAKSACAAVTVLCIFLLALRAMIRLFYAKEERGYQDAQKGKKIAGTIFLVFLLAATVVTFLFYRKSPLASYSTLNAVIYFCITAALSVGAVLLFPKRLPESAEVDE